MEESIKQITKLCVKHLRAFSKHYGFEVKSTDAHELIAAIFGYKTRASMLSDKQAPLSSLSHSKIIVQAPIEFISQRSKSLINLPPHLPGIETLVDVVYDCLKSEKFIFSEVLQYCDLEKHTMLLAHEYHHQKQLNKFYRAPSHEEVQVEITHEGILLTIIPYHPVAGYPFDGSGKNQTTSLLTTIYLKRIAGHIGYAKPEINTRPIPMLVKAQS